MSTRTAGPSQPLVLRAKNTMVAPVAVWLFCIGAVADAVIEGTLGFTLRVVVLMGAIACAAWTLLASPCLVVERDGLRVVNPLRVHWIPFGALQDVRVRGLTTLVAVRESGASRRVTSWNAPGQARWGAPTVVVSDVIERARLAWETRAGGAASAAVLVTSWRWRPITVLVLLVAANIAIWFR